MRAVRGTFVGLLALASALPLSAGPARAAPETSTTVIAHSAEGRAVTATRIGPADAPVRIVLIGQMHGDEPAGPRIVASVAQRPLPGGVAIWLVPTINPDGQAVGRRTNARGIDLNRNFPTRWQSSRRGSGTWSGPRPASEAETRAAMAFLRDVDPTIVLSFHQPFGVVDVSAPGSTAAGRHLARSLGLGVRRVGCDGPCHGNLTQWVSSELGIPALTVELSADESPEDVARAASAVRKLGRWLSAHPA